MIPKISSSWDNLHWVGIDKVSFRWDSVGQVRADKVRFDMVRLGCTCRFSREHVIKVPAYLSRKKILQLTGGGQGLSRHSSLLFGLELLEQCSSGKVCPSGPMHSTCRIFVPIPQLAEHWTSKQRCYQLNH